MEDDPKTQAAWRMGHIEDLWAEERALPRPDGTKPPKESDIFPPRLKLAATQHTVTTLRPRRWFG